MLSHPQAIENSAITRCGIESRCRSQIGRRHAAKLFRVLWGVTLVVNKRKPLLKFRHITALFYIGAILKTFTDNHMGQRIKHHNIGTGAHRQMIIGTNMRGAN